MNTAIAFVFLLGLALVRFLRYRRADAIEKRFSASPEAFACMTTDEAQAILVLLAEQEFPRVFSAAVFFALFKTYGIPSISRLLIATGQLKDQNASKRAADTGVLLLEMILNPPTSNRAIEAIARTNYLHHRYRQSGRISDADMLYTLSLFALEPSRWVGRIEWRELTLVERCATGTFFKAMGDAIEIPYDLLASHSQGWKDGLHWLHELEKWSQDYETCYLIPAESNRQLAESTLSILTDSLPYWAHNLVRSVVTVLIGKDLQRSMK